MKASSPLVSVICLCFNHRHYVIEAMTSVLNQSCTDWELIVVDDASTDGSVDVIKEFLSSNQRVKFLPLNSNVGNCKAFNLGLKIAKGDFVIDLAADDILLPERIEEGLKAFALSGPGYGVNFSDAEYIDGHGIFLYRHSDKFPHQSIPQGDIYCELIKRYFICPPTMMFRREVIDDLHGYDETLAYEDFDFWIRSSRKFKYCYIPAVLVKKRVLKNSLSARQFIPGSTHQETTYKVCLKVFSLSKTREERSALTTRLLYEIKCAAKIRNFSLSLKFIRILIRNIFSLRLTI